MKINKLVLVVFCLFLTSFFYGQNGIAYQAVIFKPGTKTLPGVSTTSIPLVNSRVCLRFTFLDISDSKEYQETITVTTDDYGIVNTTIGSGVQVAGYATSFGDVSWRTEQKTLVVELDLTANCSSFEEISRQSFASTPYAFTANNISGIASISNGGTGASTAADALNNLGAQSTANLSTNIITDATSINKYPAVKTVKDYVDSVVGGGVVDASTSVLGKIQLSGDLTGIATSPRVSDGVITSSKLADGSVITSKLGIGAVTSNSIASGAITTSKLADGSITDSKIEGPIGINKGGTGASTATGVLINLGAQSTVNLSTNMASDVGSTVKYPAVKAVEDYVKSIVVTGTPDASISVLGKIQLAGDLAGTGSTAIAPVITGGAIIAAKLATDAVETIKIKDANITTSKLADGAITDSKIAGPIGINKGGTGASTATGALINLGAQSTANLSTNILTDAALTTKYPSVKTVKDYVDGAVTTATIADANTTTKGKIQLSGDLTGTAALPRVADGAITDSKVATGISSSKVGLGNVDNTSDINKPISSATQTALNLKLDNAKVGVANGVASLDAVGKIPSSQIPPMSFTSVNVVGSEAAMLSLTGTVGSVAVRTDNNKNYILSSADATQLSNWVELIASPGEVLTVNGQIGTVLLNKSDVLLGNVDNTSDVNKPVSIATATQLALKEDLSNKVTDFAANITSDTKYPSVKAIKTYVDGAVVSSSTPDATPSVLGKIQLAGDLTGTANAPTIKSDAITTSKLADGAITANKLGTDAVEELHIKDANVTTVKLADGAIIAAKLATDAVETIKIKDANITTSKLADGAITDSKIAGPIGINKGGTGASTATGALINLGAQSTANLSTNILTDAALTTKYPSVKTVKDYVDGAVTTATIADANTTTKGKIQLSGDLTGTAALPRVADGAITDSKVATGISSSKVGLGNVDNTSDINKPISSATQTALNLKLDNAKVGVANGVASLDAVGKIPSSQIPPMSFTSVNVVGSEAAMLSLTGTVGSVAVRTDNNKNYILSSADATQLSNWVELIASPGEVLTVNGQKGTVLLNKSDVLLGNVDNTSDVNKPVSIATATQLALKEDLSNKVTDFAANITSDTKYPSVKAIKTYVDSTVSSGTPDATPSILGKIQLAGDLAGTGSTAIAPVITDGAITTTKLANGSVTTSKISGAIALSNGGTGATTAAGALTNLGAQSKDNLSTDINLDATSTVKYPAVKTIKDYVDSTVSSGTPDATPSILGKIQLAGDLAGTGSTAIAPVITDGAITTTKLANGSVTTSKISGAIALSNGGTGATTAAGALTNLGAQSKDNLSTDINLDATSTVKYPAVKTIKDYVDSTVSSGTPDATPSILGKIQLAGDLAGTGSTAIAPVITDGAITTTKLANGSVTTSKISGAIALSNGGTGATTAAGALTNLGAQSKTNLSTDISLDATSTVKYPAVKTIKDYVDGALATATPDATDVATGKIQLAGDLAGTGSTATAPVITDGAITTTKLANGSVTTSKISGAIALSNGGTGATTAAGALTNLGAQSKTNLSTDISLDATSTVKYPAVKTIKDYVDGALATATPDATDVATGKIQLAGDLAGTGSTATAPVITDGAISASKLATDAVETIKIKDANVTTAKLADNTVTTTKLANGSVTPSKISGAIALANGGTGATTAAGALANLGAQSSTNLSTDITLDAASVVKYPAVKTIKDYVDGAVTTATIADANTTTKGKIQLSGDLTGTAALPRVADGAITDSKVATGISSSKVGLGNVDNTSDINKPISSATQTALNLKLDNAKVGVANGVASLDAVGKIPSSQIPPMSFTSVNVVGSEAAMLSLTGTVGSVAVRTDNNKNYILSSADATQLSNWVELIASPGEVLTVNGQKGTVLLNKSDVLLGNVDNTSDVNKPVSIATATQLALKEDLSNKVTDFAANITSDTKYPSVKAIKTYVDSTVSSSTPDATSTTRGKIQLTGDLEGTAALPTITNAAVIGKVLTGFTSGAGTVTASDNILQALEKINGNVALKAPLISPALTGVPTAPTPLVGDNSTKVATTAFVTTALATATSDATDLATGKIQLAGDLAGTGSTATAPIITDGAITTTKLANGSVTTSKISGAIALANGGTGATTAAGALTNLGAQSKANLSTDISLDATSTVKYPAVKTIKDYVDGALATATPDATDLAKGKIQLAGDLAGTGSTATTPVITDGAITTTKLANGSVTTSKISGAIALANGGTGATTAAVALTNLGAQSIVKLSTNMASDAGSTVKYPAVSAVENYVSTVVAAATPDATDVATGKIQLAGDLAGTGSTAISPVITNSAITTVKLADNAVETIKIKDANVTSAKIANAAITTAKLGTDAVETIKIKDANVTTAKIADAAITTAKLGTDAVETVNIKDANVTTAKIADAAITDSKIAGPISINKGGTGSSTAAGALTNLGAQSSANLSTDIALDAASVVKYPAVKTIKDYVDGAVVSATPDATDLVKGKIQLSGDLTGTAASPAIKADAITSAKILDATIVTSDLATNAVETVNIKDANVTTAKIADAAITTAKLGTDAVETIKIKDANVTTAKIADAAITTAKLGTDAVETIKIKDGNVTTAKIADAAITTAKLGTDAVETVNIKDANVTTAKIADAAITDSKIAGPISINKGGTGSSTAAGALTNLGAQSSANLSTDIALDAASVVKYPAVKTIKDYVDGAVVSATPDATDLVKGKIQLSGDLTGTAASPAIKADAITSAKILDATIVTSDLATNAVETVNIKDANVTTAKIADAAITTAKLGTDAVETVNIKDANVTTAKIADAAITTAKLGTDAVETVNIKDANVTTAKIADAAITDSKIAGPISINKGGTGSSTAAGALTNLGAQSSANLSTDIALDAASVVKYPAVKTIKDYVDGAVVSATPDATDLVKGKIQLSGDLTGTAASPAIKADAITSAKILDATIVTSDLATNAVETVNIKDANVTTAKIADAAITTAKLGTDAVETVNIKDANVTTAKIADAAITTAKLGTDAVETIKIKDANVTTAKIADAAITTAKLGTDAVETVNIKDANVTTAKIADAAITDSKIAGPISINKGGTGSSTAAGALTNLGAQSSANLSTDIALDAASVVKYPAVKTIKDYVDGAVVSATPDATDLVKGKIQLSGDLTGTAASPAIKADAITSAKILDATIVTSDLATNAVETVNIKDANVTTAKIADAAITTAKLGTDAVETIKIKDANVTTAKIADAAITTAKLGTDAVETVNIKDANVTTAKIADAAITTAKLGTDAVETIKIKDGNVTTAKIADAAITTAKLGTDAVETVNIKDANVTTAKIADAAITDSKIAGPISINKGGTGSSTAAGALTNLGAQSSANLSTDIALDAASVVKYPAVKTIKDYVDGAVVSATPDATDLVKGKIQLSGDLTGTAASPAIKADAITSAKILDATIVTSDLATNAVETVNIKDANVTTAKIADAAITTAKLGTDAVETVNIKDANVTTAKIADAAITDSKIAGPISINKGGTGSSTAAGALTNLGAQSSANLSTDIASDAASVVKYPAVKTIKDYVDGAVATATPDATSSVRGKVQLAGDLAGTGSTAAAPIITDAAISTVKIANSAVDLTTKVSGILPVANGGTGINTISGYLKGNGTSAFSSVAKIPVADVAGAVKQVNGVLPDTNGNLTIAYGTVTTGIYADLPTSGGVNGDIYVVSGDSETNNGRTFINDGTTIWKEVSPNVQALDARYTRLSGGTMEGDLSFPTGTKVVVADIPVSSTDVANKIYVDEAVANATPDANLTAKGKIKLAGDLAGTADAPTVPGLLLKASLASPVFTGNPEAPTVSEGNNSTTIATTAFVTTAVTNATPDATISAKGKIQLAGDLEGTAALPIVTNAAVIGKVLTGFASSAGVVSATDSVLGAIQKVDGNVALKAPLASPDLTGVPTAPTAAVGTKTTQLATTEFVDTALTNNAVPYTGATKDVDLGYNGLKVQGLTIGNAFGSTNTAIGKDVLANNASDASGNTAVGAFALTSNTYGNDNTVVGNNSLSSNTNGDSNIAVGVRSLNSNINGGRNVAVGNSTLSSNTSGDNNLAVGDSSLASNSTGSYNLAVGNSSLDSNTGSYNIGLGYMSGRGFTDGTSNVFIGNSDANDLGLTTGNKNVIIGSNITGLPATLEKNIILADGEGTIRAQHDGTTGWDLKGSVKGVTEPATDNSTKLATTAFVTTAVSTGSTSIKNIWEGNSYTALSTDYTLLIDTWEASNAGGDYTLTLPEASTLPGKVYVIRKSNDDLGNLVINNNIQTDDGLMTINLNYVRTIRVQSDGVNWLQIN